MKDSDRRPWVEEIGERVQNSTIHLRALAYALGVPRDNLDGAIDQSLSTMKYGLFIAGYRSMLDEMPNLSKPQRDKLELKVGDMGRELLYSSMDYHYHPLFSREDQKLDIPIGLLVLVLATSGPGSKCFDHLPKTVAYFTRSEDTGNRARDYLVAHGMPVAA